ncbi:conjugative transposon protein TcpC [Actinomadura hallensis]|uniref:Conjugative transposon protein TcpC n=1 Tax=Actinomadura hallensis TaxID=337895 RepID=A0A543IAN5_9ACTN|nr:conjugal transfer protein [Actinomadura hallensis]TQM67644.1 conjugative transposon protein TcpC [Actinomadura hallensis]HLV76186.1 conjugal transfer protein [Vulgatibacteraceae bacterium]
MARRPAAGRGRDTAVVEETAPPGGALASSVDQWDAPGGDGRGRSGGGVRGGRWGGSGGRWWVWVGRAVLWAVIIVILVNGVRAPFERFTAGERSGGTAAATKPPRGAGFPSSAAGAFALQFADVYLNFDQNNAAAREAQLRTFLPDGADPQFGWNGAGKMQVQSVQVAGVDARDANNATVTLLARSGDKWLRLAVPVYADKGGSLVVSGRPALLPPPSKARLPESGLQSRDSALEGELQPFLSTFFQEYATGNQEALSRFSDGATIAGLANSVTFVQVREVVAPKGSPGERTITATVVWRPAAGGDGELEQAYQLAMVKRGDKWLVRDIRGTTRPNAS